MANSPPPNPPDSLSTPSKHTVVASWLFGTLLLGFYIWVFIYAPDELPEFKQKMVGMFSALLAGLFAFFFVGSSFHVKSNIIKGGSGIVAFALVFWVWLNPNFAPVKILSSPPIPPNSPPPIVTPDIPLPSEPTGELKSCNETNPQIDCLWEIKNNE